MKVYEMKPNEVGNAVETDDGIIVTLKEENRVLIISKKDMVVSSIKLDSVKTIDSSEKRRLGLIRVSW